MDARAEGLLCHRVQLLVAVLTALRLQSVTLPRPLLTLLLLPPPRSGSEGTDEDFFHFCQNTLTATVVNSSVIFFCAQQRLTPDKRTRQRTNAWMTVRSFVRSKRGAAP